MILLADSGATHTEWRAVEPNGRFKKIVTEGLQPYYKDDFAIRKMLRSELWPVLKGKPSTVYFYGAGVEAESNTERLYGLLRDVFPWSEVEVATDLLAAVRATCRNERGVACILGTGSNAGLAESGYLVEKAPSNGLWLGDEGSGGDLGKQLLMDWLDGLLPEGVKEAFENSYPQISRESVLESVYRKPQPARFLASFATFVKEHEALPYLGELVEKRFRLFLHKRVRAVCPSNVPELHFVGSVALAFEDKLRSVCQREGYEVGKVVANPMDELVQYHSAI